MSERKSVVAFLIGIFGLILGINSVGSAQELSPSGTPETLPEVQITPLPDAASCGTTGTQSVLFLSSDAVLGNPPHEIDAIRLIEADYDAAAVRITAIPRDLVLRAGEVSGLLTAEGAQEILADRLGIQADRAILMTMEKIPPIVDAVGGVELTIPQAITTENGVSFAAGPQTLNGYAALEYVRAIQPGGEGDRIQRQNRFLNALWARLRTDAALPALPELAAQFESSLSTDLMPEEFGNLLCLLAALDPAQVTHLQMSIP